MRPRGTGSRGRHIGALATWPQRRRKKKLIVAFHFQFSNQAGWNCDSCKKAGLEIKRRCDWIGNAQGSEPPPVWSRGGVHTCSCPKSYITAESVTLLEEYRAWKRAGGVSYLALEARALEAFSLL